MQHLYSRFSDSTRDFASMFDPCMMLKNLCERGIELQEFKLVGWLSEKLYLELLMNRSMSSETESDGLLGSHVDLRQQTLLSLQR